MTRQSCSVERRVDTAHMHLLTPLPSRMLYPILSFLVPRMVLPDGSQSRNPRHAVPVACQNLLSLVIPLSMTPAILRLVVQALLNFLDLRPPRLHSHPISTNLSRRLD